MENTGRPSVDDLTGDSPLAKAARANWLGRNAPTKVIPGVVENEIWQYLEHEDFSSFSLLLLEQLQALERYLWPGYTDSASDHHTILLALLINTKRSEQLPAWPLFTSRPDEFASFFRRILNLSIDQSLPIKIRTSLLTFIVGAFQSLDSGIIRKECAPLVSIGIWQKLHSEAVRDAALAKSTQLQKAWRASGKKFDNSDTAGQARLRFEREWLYTLLLDFTERLYAVSENKEQDLRYCERLLELLCDLESQLPTRRYVNTLLHDLNLLPAIKLSPLYDAGDDAALLRDFHALLAHYAEFPVDDQSGRQLSRGDHAELCNVRIARLQKVALRRHPEKLKILILANYGSLGQRQELAGHLEPLTDAELAELCGELTLRDHFQGTTTTFKDRAVLLEIIVSFIERKPYFADVIEHDTPVFPTESALYDPSILRTEEYNGSRPLAIPKVNLQYLAFGDFLWRSFVLYRSEAFYEIRKHCEDIIKRIQPRVQGGSTRFDGFSRMAIPINKPAIIDTALPNVGEEVSAEVKSEVILDVSRLQPGLRREWESLRPDDVVFLLAVHPKDTSRRLTNGHQTVSSAEKIGLQAVRCAEVISVLDENGRVLRFEGRQNDDDGFKRPRQRRLLLRLDAAVYKQDKARADAGKSDIYESINLVVRRRSRENNFRSVLQSIKQLMVSDIPTPTWLEEVFLGFGDPASATYKRLSTRHKSVDYRDTFLDWQHLVEALVGKTIEPDPKFDSSFPPPYVLETSESQPPAVSAARPTKKRRRDQPDGTDSTPAAETIKVTTYQPENAGPYPTDAPKLNAVRFTPAQIEAVTSGTQPGLTVVVGPPGTGKTDVATQIINNIYHNFPQQRTLLIAHSNQALNQLFQKIVALDIDERHLLRLGHGEEELETEGSFSKAGRIESFLERGGQYLAEVNRLAASIGAPGAHGSTCETAQYFDQVYVEPAWSRYWDEVKVGGDIAESFPFQAFFADAPQPLFAPGASREQHLDVATGCERHIRRVFDELADIRPFEILRSQKDKANYLLVKEARVVAMTSTHAAMNRQHIASLGFHYDNVIMEEAAQVTEIENFIPFALQGSRSTVTNGKPTADQLQRPATDHLQRIILVGDHLQNSPVIQNAAFRSYANLSQSLFQRLIRLGVPHILLDAQGRSRPSIAELYAWRYPRLTNLPFTATAPEFVRANAGLRYEYQFIDVPEYKGKGETEPSPHFLQNLGEAEYCVALFQYMRLLGYPAEKISILCAYAGQRALIRDVLAHRCKSNSLFGMPGWVGTIDKYQGEQNDYVILSLVRTKSPGYLRDLRRLTVALSRARLGLYVFGRRDVFESSLELREAFDLLFQRSNKLSLVTGEMFPAGSRAVGDEVDATEMEGVEHLGQYVFEMTQAKVKALKEGGGVLPPQAPAVNGGAEEEEDEEEDGEGLEEEVEEMTE